MPKSRKTRPSSTPGRTKSDNCHKSQTKNRYCKDARFYRTDPLGYLKACEAVYNVNAKKGSTLKSGWIEEYKKEVLNK